MFISFDGIDGGGKTTQINAACEYLESLGLQVVRSREPGGTPLGETLRGLLLSEVMHPVTELMLMFSSRMQHVKYVVEPALEQGKTVVLDRFSDASYAYQVHARGTDESVFDSLVKIVHEHLHPDITFIFDLPPEVAAKRMGTRDLDKFEQESIAFFARAREGYLIRANRQNNPTRYVILDCLQTIEDIKSTVRFELDKLIKERTTV